MKICNDKSILKINRTEFKKSFSDLLLTITYSWGGRGS